ncbi:hypothetical protein EDD21DRAFT_424143 [Dissophora ornata]|nr:hypothetical protein BGZ58_009248 [Dissophora ornata]KAI8603440.1 hypothetical protein EDD21DRAFT_424143 [Dissophora ornata]
MSMEHTVVKPKVLIIGAGLSGLSLAAILDRAGVPYEIFEKASALKPLGSAICLGPGVMPMFTQLGVIDQIEAKGKINKESFMYNEKLELLTRSDYSTGYEERFGWKTYIISRPALHNILLNSIPQEKIHLNKRLLSFEETLDGVAIRTADDQTYHGNILVGADGAYSGVRQFLYSQLSKKGSLPALDTLPMKYSTVCLVGQTRPLTEEEYVNINDDVCRTEFMLADTKPFFFVMFTTAENTVCWMVLEMLDGATSKKHDGFRESDWGPEAVDSMIQQIRGFSVRKNLTMGELIDLTPKEVIRKVILEEKLFETWTSGRTALMGDACHKMPPNAGLGGQSAMYDAVVLGNYLSSLTTNSTKDIEKALLAYRDERYQHAKDSVAMSSALTKILKKNLLGMLLRKALNHLPRWLHNLLGARINGYRPQISFLPPVDDKGTRPPMFQPSLEKTRPGTTTIV